MSNQLTNTGITTAGIFGMKRAREWGPVKGCSNRGCHMHPSHKTRHPIYPGECWAAKMCNRMAIPWSESEANLKCGKSNAASNIQYPNDGYPAWKKVYDGIYEKLKTFKPVWLESQFEKQFPKKRSCILVCYMTDIAFIPGKWIQKIIDKINANNQEREKVGLLLHIFPFLTKYPAVYAHFKWPANCWLGFTATNQDEFDERISVIHDSFTTTTPEGRSLLSALWYAYLEPLSGQIKINRNPKIFVKNWIKWVIVGGGPTPLHPDWVRSIRDQCQAAIKFHFKSWGKYFGTNSKDKSQWMKTEKWLPNNLLDGRLWEQFPEVS